MPTLALHKLLNTKNSWPLMFIVLNLILFFFVQLVFACPVNLENLPEAFRELQNTFVTTRTGLQGTLDMNDFSITFRTADGKSAELLGGNRDGVVQMQMISIDEEIQGQGVQTLLFERLIQNARAQGAVRYIRISHLVDDNKRAVLMHLVNRMGLQIDEGMSTWALERLLLESHQETVTQLLQNPTILNEAILASPTFRSFARHGFGAICQGSAVAQITTRQITVIANACPP